MVLCSNKLQESERVCSGICIVAHRQAGALISGKPLFYEGELYSEEHKRKFKTERAGFQVVKNPKDKSKLALAINGQPIGKWFKEQFGKLFTSVKKTVIHTRNKGVKI